MAERLAEDAPTLVGIDHSFCFPLRYFEVHLIEPGCLAAADGSAVSSGQLPEARYVAR
jgi:hypothetical protein